jgi:hypothetical protein
MLMKEELRKKKQKGNAINEVCSLSFSSSCFWHGAF